MSVAEAPVQTRILILPTEEGLKAEAEALARAEHGEGELFLWEPRDRACVLGLGGSEAEDLDLKACAGFGIPALRRASGGGTVLQAPGILNAVVTRPGTGVFGGARALMAELAQGLAAALGECGFSARVRGRGDLAEAGGEDRKLAGLASRARGRGEMAHASLLVDPDLSLMDKVLKHPRREPEYRRGRSHRDFLGRLPALKDEGLKRAFARALARFLNMEGRTR